MMLIKDLNKSFKGKSIIMDFSREFKTSNIYLLDGPNGVGKTTLLKMIKGIITPDNGTIKFTNYSDIKHHTSYIDANNRSFFHRLTVRENLKYFTALNKKSRNMMMVDDLTKEFGIEHLLDEIFSVLSVGQMQLIALVRGLIEKPQILLLDEALINIDKQRIETVSKFLENFIATKENIVILCSHATLPINISETVTLK